MFNQQHALENLQALNLVVDSSKMDFSCLSMLFEAVPRLKDLVVLAKSSTSINILDFTQSIKSAKHLESIRLSFERGTYNETVNEIMGNIF